jgi:hypothetical protein
VLFLVASYDQIYEEKSQPPFHCEMEVEVSVCENLKQWGQIKLKV